MVRGPVKSITAMYAGAVCPYAGLVKPDPDAMRECLPPQYRHAFDLSGGNMWHPSKHGMASIELFNRRHRYLNTLYATPYMCDPTKPSLLEAHLIAGFDRF
jgi:hypothetical protein